MPEIAYVLKAFPRLSETFIASEILRVEQAGQPVRLFVMKPVEPWERADSYPVVERISARPVCLPRSGSLSNSTLRRWLRRNLPAHLPALRRVARRHPLRTARVALAALAQMARELPRAGRRLPDVYVKELLQAVALADELTRCPDVAHLHAHFAHGATTVTWWASRITGLPFSFTAHARDIWSPAINPGGLLARKLRAARFVVTCTEANRRHLQSLAPGARVHLVYHGLNDDVSREIATAPPPAERNGRLRVLGVGRLVRKKGFDVLVDACAELRRREVPFEAAIVGPAGDHADELRRRIGALGLEGRVSLAGVMDQVRLCEEYRRADVLAQPCRLLADDRDGIPNVLVEGMACGVPVVATAVSGIPELVSDGVNGLLVPPDDPRALADALQRLWDDRALARRLGRAGADTVRERFDGERLAGRLVELFAGAAA
ncbi:MAG TPA: glycosyltransferase family 4 protein [Solirubrobacteraceae bacterium]|jgi:glycosyltransferase involved in cell wall biosynthesis